MRGDCVRLFFCLLLALLLPSCSPADRAPTLLIATDPHFISPALTDHGPFFMRLVEDGDGKLVHYCNELTDTFVQQVIEKKPDCLILSGDLTFNGAKKSHEDFAAKLRRIDQSGIPVLVLPGNHDLYCYAAAQFSGDGYTLSERTSSEEFAAIYHDLGFDIAIDRDPYSLSYIAEPIPGIRILMLDTNTQFMEGIVAQNTFVWLENVLSRAQHDGAKVIAVSHQNLYAHSSLLYKGYIILNTAMLKSRYEHYGVAANFSGHVHMQHIMDPEGQIPEIVTSSLAVSPCQYGVLTLQDNHAQYAAETVDVSAWARSIGSLDPNLLHFEQYAADFFRATSTPDASGKKEPDPLFTWMADLNSAYFAGRLDSIHRESEYAQRMQQDDSFFSLYMQSILAEPPRNHTQFSFPF